MERYTNVKNGKGMTKILMALIVSKGLMEERPMVVPAPHTLTK